MGVPRPKIPTPPLPLIARAFAQLGLAQPVSIEPLAPAWVHANFRVRLAGGVEVLLRRLVADPGVDTLHHEAAALSALRGVDLPIVRNYRIVTPGLLPWPAVISEILPGVQGIAVMRRHPEHGSAICASVGQFMTELATHRRPRFGTAVDGLQFTARRATWSAEWGALTYGWWHTARSAGTHLGPLGEAVYDRVKQRLSALDTAKEWCIIHGDLHPSNFLFGRPASPELAPPLSGVVDWEGALVGDPLLEWALMVELPAATLGHILQGVGVDRVRQVLDAPDALARLEVYALSRCIRRLSFSAMTLFSGDTGLRRSYALEYGRLIATERLQTTIADKLEAALSLGTSGEIVQQVPAPRAHRVLWQALDATRHRPPLTSQHIPVLLGSLSAALLAKNHVDEPWREVALSWAGALGSQYIAVSGEPISDRAAWSNVQASRCGPASGQSTQALALWWLLHEARAALAAADAPDPFSDDLLRGLESLMLRLSAPRDTTPGAGLEIVHAFVGLASMKRLRQLGIAAPAETVHSELTERLQLAWEDLTLFGDAPLGSTDAQEVLDEWPKTPQLDQPMVPLLLLALRVLDGDLPAPAARILGALGLVAQQES
ncbi:MAG: phosphotransferase [Rhodobacterales bacterium]|nr:phosphotransferase [Rhodobacterales bacterium]